MLITAQHSMHITNIDVK